jgi:3-dehydroquinate dehydratase type I
VPHHAVVQTAREHSLRRSQSTMRVYAASASQVQELPERCLLWCGPLSGRAPFVFKSNPLSTALPLTLENVSSTSVTATTLEAALQELRDAETCGADVVELRLDYLASVDEQSLPQLLAASSLPLIATRRASWEGGRPFNGTELERLETLWSAVRIGVAFVDVELAAADRFFALAPVGWSRESSPTRIILSSHNFESTPSLAALTEIHRTAVECGAHIVKIATHCRSVMDVECLAALLASHSNMPTIALGMGESGMVSPSRAPCISDRLLTSFASNLCQVSRLLAPKFGSYLTFGALRTGKESAPGQLPLRDLVSTYRLRSQVHPLQTRIRFWTRAAHTLLTEYRDISTWRDWKPDIPQPEPTDSQCGVGGSWIGYRVHSFSR